MRCVDSTFCFDILQKDPGTARRPEGYDASAEHRTIAVPALREVLEATIGEGGSISDEYRGWTDGSKRWG